MMSGLRELLSDCCTCSSWTMTLWQQEPKAVFKEIHVGEIRVDQIVWESSVAVRLWVLGEGKTDKKHTNRSMEAEISRVY